MNFLYKGKAIDSLMTKKLHEFFGFKINNYDYASSICHNEIIDAKTIDKHLKDIYLSEFIVVYDGISFDVLMCKKVISLNYEDNTKYKYYKFQNNHDEFKKYCKILCICDKWLTCSYFVLGIVSFAIAIASFIICMLFIKVHLASVSGLLLGAVLLCLILWLSTSKLLQRIAKPYIDKVNLGLDSLKNSIEKNQLSVYVYDEKTEEVIIPKKVTNQMMENADKNAIQYSSNGLK